VPATRLPEPETRKYPEGLLVDLALLLDEQQRVDDAGRLVASFLVSGGSSEVLVSALASCLLRENRNFHTTQCIEAAVRQHHRLQGTGDEAVPLIAAARYLAAHAPTTRSQRQTYDIARRLHRGERLHDEAAIAQS
jgi:hypothetical protein